LQIAGATAGFLAVQGCAEPGSPDILPVAEVDPSEARYGGTLRIAYSSIPSQLDPALAVSSEDNQVNFAVYEGLVRIGGNLLPEPVLALSWQPSDDLSKSLFDG
jgi:peptide/nickel transport system substrate-binding protein